MATPGDSSPSYPPDGHAAAEPTAALPDDLRDVSVGPLMTAEDPFMASADLSWPNQFFNSSDQSPSPSPSPSPPTPVNLLPYQPDLEDISDDEDSCSSPARKRSRVGLPQAADTTTQVTPNSSPDMDVPTVPPATPAPPTPSLNPATPYTPYTPAALPSVGPPPGTSAADPSPPSPSPRSPINSTNFRSVYSSNSGPSADFEGFITMEEYMEKRNAIEKERWRKPKDKRVAKQHLCDRKQREKKTQAHSVLNQVGDALVNVLALRSDYARDPLMDHLIRLMDPYFSRHYGQDRTIRNEAAKLESV